MIFTRRSRPATVSVPSYRAASPAGMTLFPILLFLLLSCPLLLFGQGGVTGRRTVAPGVVHTEYTLPGPNTLDVLEVSLREPLIALESYRPGGLVRTTEQAVANDREGHGVVGAINADFFTSTPPGPVGNQVVNGTFVQGLSSARSHLAIDSARRPFIERVAFRGTVLARSGNTAAVTSVNGTRAAGKLVFYTLYWGYQTGTDGSGRECAVEFIDPPSAGDTLRARVTEVGNSNLTIPALGGVLSGGSGTAASFLGNNLAVGDTVRLWLGFSAPLHSITQLLGGAGRLLMHGRNVVDSMATLEGLATTFTDVRNPRTFVGFNADTSTLFLCTVDGRQTTSVGMTFDEMADFLLSIGVADAFNFDGGGSTTMVVRGAIVNSPSDAAGERPVANTLQVISRAFTGVAPHTAAVAADFRLLQNYPNPFNPCTTIQYQLPVRSSVRVIISNVLGQTMAEFSWAAQAAGLQSFTWRASVPSGVYLYRLEAKAAGHAFSDVKKMMVLR